MKRLFFYSKSQLKFVEIKNFKTKLFIYLLAGFTFLSLTLFGIYSLISSMTGVRDLATLRKENEFLQREIQTLSNKFVDLNQALDSLGTVNNYLRLAANLKPYSEDEKIIGVGGGYFDNTVDFLTSESMVNLHKAFSYIDEATRKLEFEKLQYLEITGKLKENRKLFESIPALKPCEGVVGVHGFGFRVHPILNINRMHDGIDIITDYNTSIFSPGKGMIDFVGYRGGLGLAVEIDHGFGYRTIYGHLSKVEVKPGQRISRGDLIAKSGNSGLSSGPHLHYEVHHNGIKQNPEEFFFDDLSVFEYKKQIGKF